MDAEARTAGSTVRGSLDGMLVVRMVAALAAVACAVVAALITALVLLPAQQVRSTLVAKAAAFGGYAPLLWLLVTLLLALALTRRRRRAVLALGAVVSLWAASLIPQWWPHEALGPPADASRVTLLSLNTLYGHADPASVAALIRAEDPDVIVLLEAQRPLLQSLDASGAIAAYAHRLADLPPGYEVAHVENDKGTLVLSKPAFDVLERLDTPTQEYVLRVHSERPFTLIAARPRNPMSGVQAWEHDGRVLADAIARHGDGPLVVAGDLNAVRVHATYRWFLDAGVHDASDDTGTGWRPTYPVRPFPVLDLDHVLLNHQVTATELRTVSAQRTDHLGLVAQLALHPAN